MGRSTVPQSHASATDASSTPLEDILALHRALIAARAQSPDLDAFLAAVLETLCGHLGADGALIGLCTPDHRGLTRVAATGAAPPVLPSTTVPPLPCRFPGDAADRNARALEWAEAVAESSGPQALAAAMLAVRGQDIGIVCLFGQPQAPRTAWQQEGLEAAALEIGLATSHLQLRADVEASLRQRTERWSALYELAVALTRGMDSDQLLDDLVQRAIQLLHARGGSLSITDEATGESVVTVAYLDGAPSPMMTGYRLPPGRGLAAQVMQSGHTLYVPDYQFPEGQPSESGLRTSVIAAPLFVQNEAAGVLAVGDNPAIRTFTDDDIQTVELLAQAAGAILEKVYGRRQQQSLTILNERARLARELHDGLAQNLASLLLKAELCHDLAREGDPGLPNELDQLADGIQRAVRETRAAIASLHDSPSTTARLLKALGLLAARFEEQTGQPVELVYEADQELDLSSAQHMALLRLAQEALTNVRKHASATRVCVCLNAACRKTIELSVEDNGHGFDRVAVDQASGHYGILGMRTRMEELGGSFRIDTQPGAGTTVTAVLPLTGGRPGDGENNGPHRR